MNCEQTKNILHQWADEELPAERMKRVSAHLRDCPRCAAEAAEILALSSALGAMPPAPGAEGLARKTVAKFRAEVADETVLRWWEHLSAGMRGAACAMAVAGLVLGLVLGGSLNLALPSEASAADLYVSLLDNSFGGLL